MIFEQQLHNAQQRFEQGIVERLDALMSTGAASTPCPAEKSQLLEAMRYALLMGGKRLRPLLVYATGDMLKVASKNLDPLAQAIECIHAYSLVHDDLPAMDDDDLRRGHPTCHIAFDEATAILAGDALQTLAFDILSSAEFHDVPASAQVKLIRQLAQASGYAGMCGGQALDLAATGQKITQDELQELHQKKTGALIKVAILMVTSLTPDLPTAHINALQEYADAVGLAFQVQDDILDVIGDSETLGKPQGSDQALEKSTYPALLGLDGAKQYLTSLHKQALHALAALPYNTQVLASIADFTVQRTH